jgi:hypothetical protein
MLLVERSCQLEIQRRSIQLQGLVLRPQRRLQQEREKIRANRVFEQRRRIRNRRFSPTDPFVQHHVETPQPITNGGTGDATTFIDDDTPIPITYHPTRSWDPMGGKRSWSTLILITPTSLKAAFS